MSKIKNNKQKELINYNNNIFKNKKFNQIF